MISAALKPQVRNIKTWRLPERKPVTIALGFKAEPGLVLCSDTQMTSDGGFKFEEHKYLIPCEARGFSLIGIYAGLPSMAKAVERQLCEYYIKNGGPFKVREFMAELQRIVNRVCAKERGPLQMLWAFSDKYTLELFRVDRRNINYVDDGFACLGIGDSSLIRFLADNMRIERTRDATRTAFYMVSQAMKYVDGVGGSIDVFAVYRNGLSRSIEDKGKGKKKAATGIGA